MTGKIYLRTLIRIGVCCLSLLFLLIVTENRASAQEPGEPVLWEDKGLTVRVDVDEIRIDAVVVDWRGRYITDLTADDFEIYQDGEPQEITSCRYVRYDRESPDVDVSDLRQIPDLPAASSPILKKEDVRRTLVFLVDNLMMNFENVYYARMALTKFVEEQMQPGDLVAILSTSKGYLGPLAFTSDKKQLLAHVQSIRKDFFSIPATRCDSQYQHMLALVRYFNESLRQMPGRNSLIWISGLTRMPSAPPMGEFDDNECRWRLIQTFDSLADEMLHTGVVFHTMDITGLQADPRATNPHEGQGTAIPLSEKTGGLFIENENFFVDGIGRLEEEMQGYYLLTYIPPAGTFASDGSEISHEIDIKSKRWMSEVRHRDHIFTGENAAYASEQSRDSLQQAVYSPFQYNDLSIRLSAGYVRDSGKDGLLRSWLHVDGEKLKVGEEANGDKYIAVETLGVISDSNGRIWDEGRQLYRMPVREEELYIIRENGLRVTMDIPAKKPGAYFVRMAAKDRESGIQGSAYQYVEVPDLEKDRLALSDIFISGGRGDTRKMEGVRSALDPYTQGETIRYEVVIYNAKAKKKPPKLEYQYVLYRDGVEVMRNGPVMVDTGSLNDFGEITLSNELRLPHSLDPGSYALQLEVRDTQAKEKNGIATQWMDFEITTGSAADYIDSGEEWMQKGIEAEHNGNREEMMTAFREAAGLYRKALEENSDNAVALKGLIDVANNVQEYSKKLEAVQDSGEIQKDREYWIRRATEWREAVENHEPGMIDEAAITIGSWPAEDVLAIHNLVMYVEARSSGTFNYDVIILRKEFTDKYISFGDIIPSLNLEPDRGYIMRRAGLLYTDIDTLQTDTGIGEGIDGTQMPNVNDQGASGERTFYQELAGQMIGDGPDEIIE
jgi:VWFA-related protein